MITHPLGPPLCGHRGGKRGKEKPALGWRAGFKNGDKTRELISLMINI
jgi:hypothetical protein